MGDEIRIEMTGHGQGKVFVDGVELRGVKSVSFNMIPQGANVVHIEVYTNKLKVSGPAKINVTEVEE